MFGVLTCGFPKQLGSANPMSSMKMTTMLGGVSLTSFPAVNSAAQLKAINDRGA
jgi:hypothetical protein